jgi:hypothetical protein
MVSDGRERTLGYAYRMEFITVVWLGQFFFSIIRHFILSIGPVVAVAVFRGRESLE